MEIRQLISFVQIARNQNFTKAAEQLGYSQSAITIQIRNLEEELGVKLFDRIGKKTILTSQGERFMEYAMLVLKDVNRAKLALAKEELVDEIHIGTIESLCFARFPDLLEKLHRLHPKMRVKITLGTPEQLIENMERGELDMIYILDRPRYSSRWVKVVEQREDIVFVCNAENPLAEKRTVPFSELVESPFILTEKNANYRSAFDHFLAAKKLELEPYLEISDTEFIVRMLTETECVSLLPYFAVEEAVKEGKLAVLKVQGFHTSMYSQMFYHKDKWVTQEMRETIRVMKETI